jgi:hypothetical protein
LAIRQLFGAFCSAIVLIGVALVFVVDSGGDDDSGLGVSTACAVVAVVGIVALAANRLFADRPLECGDPAALSSSHRSRFFLQMAISEAIALVGFVLSVISRSLWPYLVAVPFTAVGFAWAAPTKTRLARDQEQLTTSGCQQNLVASIRRIDGSG